METAIVEMQKEVEQIGLSDRLHAQMLPEQQKRIDLLRALGEDAICLKEWWEYQPDAVQRLGFPKVDPLHLAPVMFDSRTKKFLDHADGKEKGYLDRGPSTWESRGHTDNVSVYNPCLDIHERMSVVSIGSIIATWHHKAKVLPLCELSDSIPTTVLPRIAQVKEAKLFNVIEVLAPTSKFRARSEPLPLLRDPIVLGSIGPLDKPLERTYFFIIAWDEPYIKEWLNNG